MSPAGLADAGAIFMLAVSVLAMCLAPAVDEEGEPEETDHKTQATWKRC